MLKFVWKWFGVGYVKKLLDKVPGDGKKTIVGVLLIILSIAAEMFPIYSSIFVDFANILKDVFEAQPLLTAGTIATVIGFLHKALKVFEKMLQVAED